MTTKKRAGFAVSDTLTEAERREIAAALRAAGRRVVDAEHPTEDWTKAPPLKGPCLRAFHAFAAAHKDAWEDVPLDQVFKAGYEAGRARRLARARSSR